MLVAFGGKTLVAVLLGQSLAQVPTRWTTALSALIFFSTAVFIWFRKPEPCAAQPLAARTWPQATLVPFASLFLTEWGDTGQMSAAALTAQSKLPVAVWAGATLALMTKGVFAMALGLKLRERIPERALRRTAAISCCVLGALALRDAVLLFRA